MQNERVISSTDHFHPHYDYTMLYYPGTTFFNNITSPAYPERYNYVYVTSLFLRPRLGS